jgi:hypothetical protein
VIGFNQSITRTGQQGPWFVLVVRIIARAQDTQHMQLKVDSQIARAATLEEFDWATYRTHPAYERSPWPAPVSQSVPGQSARQPREARRVRLVYQHLLETASNREHRAALRLLPRFGCLGLLENYIAAIAAVRSRPPRL